MISDEDVDAFLAHYGVKGMRWGVRRDPKTGVRPIAKTLNEGRIGRASKANVDRHNARVNNRKLNKASRRADAKKHETEVETARERVRSGKSKRDVKQAKREYKQNKHEIGSREAKKILKKARDQRIKDLEDAQKFKNNKEVAAMLAIFGGVVAARYVYEYKKLAPYYD